MRRSFQQSKMASDEETQAQDPKSNSESKEKKSKKKSKKKTERDNQRAAIFQERKKDEAKFVAAAATHSSSSSVAVTSTPTPDKDFEFSEPLSVNISGLDDSKFINLDGNVTLNQSTTSSEGGKENGEGRKTASEDPHSKGGSKDELKDDSKDGSKDDIKDDSRVEIPRSAPSPEQEKDGTDTDNSDSKVVDRSNTPSSTIAVCTRARIHRFQQVRLKEKNRRRLATISLSVKER